MPAIRRWIKSYFGKLLLYPTIQSNQRIQSKQIRTIYQTFWHLYLAPWLTALSYYYFRPWCYPHFVYCSPQLHYHQWMMMMSMLQSDDDGDYWLPWLFVLFEIQMMLMRKEQSIQRQNQSVILDWNLMMMMMMFRLQMLFFVVYSVVIAVVVDYTDQCDRHSWWWWSLKLTIT